MAVTQTIRYVGSYREVMVFQQMLEQQGVHVELPWKGHRRLKRAQQRGQEWQILLERAELLERHDREERELLQWLGQEPPGLRERHMWELRELDRRHDREREEMGMPPKGSDAGPAPLVSLRQMFGADLDRVGISLRSTGAAAAIAETVEEFREVAPDSKVEVQGEPHTANDGNPFPPQAHSTLAPPVPPASARCTATTRAGARCKLQAEPDGVCLVHRPRGPQAQS
jgi:hypothetical protein